MSALRKLAVIYPKRISLRLLTLRRALRKADDGAHIVATTLCDYADEPAHLKPPDFSLLQQLTRRLSVLLICEGGISSPEQARPAIDCGAFAVVVGNAITGGDKLVRSFCAALIL